MLHIHKNLDGTYFIEVSLVVDGVEVMRLCGNFQYLDNESREMDKDSQFEFDIYFIGE